MPFDNTTSSPALPKGGELSNATSEHPSSPDEPKSASPQSNRLAKVQTAPAQRLRANTRNVSKSGGMQVVLNEAGSWSDLADKSATLPAEGIRGAGNLKAGKPSSMLGFLSRKGGRARSPKPREAGVLGKEGARVVISSGK
jgi:serine/threonine kinase 32